MGDREFTLDPEAICDYCGTIGAFSIDGDYICPECASCFLWSEDEYTRGGDA